MDNHTNTSGGAKVGGSVGTGGGDFVGRDKIINQGEKSQRYEQWQIALDWEKNPDKPSMRGFDLTNQDLSGLVLNGADLSRAKLNGANLQATQLIGANLSRAKLKGADLRGAKLNNANLSQSDLRQAKVGSADFTGADLSEVNSILCVPDKKTIWPIGFKPPTITIPIFTKKSTFR